MSQSFPLALPNPPVLYIQPFTTTTALQVSPALHNSRPVQAASQFRSSAISGVSGVSLLGLRADVQHVVASDEGIAVLVLQLTIDVLLGLLHGEVHVAILR